MVPPAALALAAFSGVASVAATVIERAPSDPCAKIAGQKWVAPADVRACYSSFKVDEAAKSNIIDVIGKTLAFHTSTNYQILAPPPFTLDVHENVLESLQRIKKSSYKSDYDLHIDFSRTLKRLNDGHCVWINYCYDSLYLNFLPTPLVLLTDAKGKQNVHIAPKAFEVASAEFPDQIDVWQNALPGDLKGKLSSLSGAKVLLINGLDPWFAVNANAAITGSYQAFGTRQNSFFSSYQLTASGWTYIMGNFAQQSLPLDDSVTLTIQRVNSTKVETVTLPYRSRFGTVGTQFNDSASYRELNCKAREGTNGINIYDRTIDPSTTPFAKAQYQPKLSPSDIKKHPINVLLDAEPLMDVVLPPALQPKSPLPGGYSVAQFYMLEDGKTGVFALGSFSAASYEGLMQAILDGLLALKSRGATQLVIDVTNNGGGYICAAHFLHRVIVGPKSTTVPQAGLDTTARAGPLAQQIVKKIVYEGADPEGGLLYNPSNWRAANNTFLTGDWLDPPVRKVINLRPDAFSLRLGQECQPEGFTTTPPDVGLFDPKKVIIVNNGRCGSSCSLFSITMSKSEGSKTVVVGGKSTIPQDYCGVVGGQSTGFSTIDTEIKTVGLKNSPLAPPDLIVNGVQGITWRLGYGIDNSNEPEEWQDHPADYNWKLTPETANNPVALWKEIAAKVLG